MAATQRAGLLKAVGTWLAAAGVAALGWCEVGVVVARIISYQLQST